MDYSFRSLRYKRTPLRRSASKVQCPLAAMSGTSSRAVRVDDDPTRCGVLRQPSRRYRVLCQKQPGAGMQTFRFRVRFVEHEAGHLSPRQQGTQRLIPRHESCRRVLIACEAIVPHVALKQVQAHHGAAANHRDGYAR